MEIRNENFKVGERYKGEINGVTLEVSDIRFGIDGTEYVEFKISGGERFVYDSETAKRFLLTKIN